jgi:hypothetical protein
LHLGRYVTLVTLRNVALCYILTQFTADTSTRGGNKHMMFHKLVLEKGADKSLARRTSRCILFDGENISFDASLVLYIYIYIYIYVYIVLIFLQL